MERYADGWKSAALGKQMEIVVYGHYGPGLLFFPFQGEDHLSAEQHELIAAAQPHLDAGRVKIYTISSIDHESWLNDDITPRQRSIRHQKYNKYITAEVVPFIARNMRSTRPVIHSSGISLGALHAVNSYLRRPDLFESTIGISGNYDLKAFTKGYYDNDVYFNSPQDYLANLTGPLLNNLRQKQNISLLSGQGDGENPNASKSLGELLLSKGIPNWVDLWGEDFGHNWDSWRTMFRTAIERNF
jgi:esterase/lipase superfamily enzyme